MNTSQSDLHKEKFTGPFDLLVHNLLDNTVKVVRLDRNNESFVDNATLFHDYVEHFKKSLSEPLECKYTTDQTVEFYTTSTRTSTGYIYNTTKKVNVLVYQIKCVEILETFPFFIPKAPKLPQLVNECGTQWIEPERSESPREKSQNPFYSEQAFPKSQFLDELTSRLETYKFGLSNPCEGNGAMQFPNFPRSGTMPSFPNFGSHLLD